MADDFTLKWDATEEQLYGENPDTGDRVPVPFESVNTDDASVANEPTGNDDALRWQEGAEVGVVQADGVDASGDDGTWNTSTTTSTTETFDSSFTATPKIATNISQDEDRTTDYIVTTINKSATGFDMFFFKYGSEDDSGTTGAYAADYVASEGR